MPTNQSNPAFPVSFQPQGQSQGPDPYMFLNNYLTAAIQPPALPDIFQRQQRPQVNQHPDQAYQSQPIPTPTPPQNQQVQGNPQQSQQLLQALSLQALLGQLASPFGGVPASLFRNPQQLGGQYDLIGSDPAIAALFDQGNYYKNDPVARRHFSNIQFPTPMFQGGPRGFIDPNVLAQAATVINAIIQAGGSLPNA